MFHWCWVAFMPIDPGCQNLAEKRSLGLWVYGKMPDLLPGYANLEQKAELHTNWPSKFLQPPHTIYLPASWELLFIYFFTHRIHPGRSHSNTLWCCSVASPSVALSGWYTVVWTRVWKVKLESRRWQSPKRSLVLKSDMLHLNSLEGGTTPTSNPTKFSWQKYG